MVQLILKYNNNKKCYAILKQGYSHFCLTIVINKIKIQIEWNHPVYPDSILNLVASFQTIAIYNEDKLICLTSYLKTKLQTNISFRELQLVLSVSPGKCPVISSHHVGLLLT
jgi:hypothetical protein